LRLDTRQEEELAVDCTTAMGVVHAQVDHLLADWNLIDCHCVPRKDVVSMERECRYERVVHLSADIRDGSLAGM
jgi:hypothetical protein